MNNQDRHAFDILAKAFPFHFVVTTELRLVRAGKRLLDMVPELRGGSPIADHFRVERPNVPLTGERIRQRGESVFILTIPAAGGLRLRGQFFEAQSDKSGLIFFLGHPWVTDLAEMEPAGLSLADFPPHAGITDMLVLLQTTKSASDESRQLAGRLQDASAQLEVRNTQLQEELAQRQQLEETVLQSQKMEAIGQLAGGVAHDFNNILLAINGHAALAAQNLDADSDTAQHMEHILEASRRAADLTSRLLAFGRRKVMVPTEVDIVKALDEVEKILRPLLGERVHLKIEYPSELDTVIIDPSALQQILLNLAINARDAFVDEGAITIRANSADLDETRTLPSGKRLRRGSWATIEVEDDGCGMDKAILDRIFEPFFTTKRPGHGTGLGLSTVWWIVDRCSGTIEVESRVGDGTCVRVHLPRGKATDPAHIVHGEGAIERDSMRTGDILLVEDEEMVRTPIAHMLRNMGWSVTEASDADQALAKAEQRTSPFDIVLSDMVMPGLSGRDLAVLLRERWPHMPIVFITGYDPDSAGGVVAADELVLSKPFGPEELGRMLSRAMQKA